MKVYIIVGYIDYEGCTEPDAVFDSLDKAEKALSEYNSRYAKYEIFEMEVL